MLCELVAVISKEITAAQAVLVLEQVKPSGAVETARYELAAEFLGDLRHLDAQLRDTKKKLAVAVRVSGTTVTEIFGVGPVIAGTVIGDAGDVSRLPGRGHFAAYNGTAPAGVSSGDRNTCRLSLRGNRRINHAIHMAAGPNSDPHFRSQPYNLSSRSSLAKSLLSYRIVWSWSASTSSTRHREAIDAGQPGSPAYLRTCQLTADAPLARDVRASASRKRLRGIGLTSWLLQA